MHKYNGICNSSKSLLRNEFYFERGNKIKHWCKKIFIVLLSPEFKY